MGLGPHKRFQEIKNESKGTKSRTAALSQREAVNEQKWGDDPVEKNKWKNKSFYQKANVKSSRRCSRKRGEIKKSEKNHQKGAFPRLTGEVRSVRGGVRNTKGVSKTMS